MDLIKTLVNPCLTQPDLSCQSTSLLTKSVLPPGWTWLDFGELGLLLFSNSLGLLLVQAIVQAYCCSAIVLIGSIKMFQVLAQLQPLTPLGLTTVSTAHSLSGHDQQFNINLSRLYYSTALYTPVETSRAQLLLNKPIKSAVDSYSNHSSPRQYKAVL